MAIKIFLVCPDLCLLIFVCLLFSFVVVVVFCVCSLWREEVVGSSRVVCFLFYFVFLNVSIISY